MLFNPNAKPFGLIKSRVHQAKTGLEDKRIGMAFTILIVGGTAVDQ
jgi:hypothetical protein